MAADEPPYLTVGTDVSARYKGAFCEAKIKKVNRVVKCKVTFKNNQGSAQVPDDQIRGSLRIGALVEARHPEKNQYFDAIINKMQDYSQYTVVFDDGDETTLRRTSLCLKSGRHFAESPTLDQFPLTNPEHFSTPVIGVVKSKRKRRSTYNSAAIDYSSSDEDLIPKKTKSPRSRDKTRDIGKVVCVEYGDRRKKDSWYPGLIVLANSSQDTFKINTKDEYLIRSFKDGKYYQVPKKDTRDFSREAFRKVESNTLKTAVEKALSYREKGELPPHWDKALNLGVDSASGDEALHDSDSDTSDDEPSEEKDRFVAQLYKFMDERGTPINKAPTVGSKDINLYKLFKVVHKMGGCNRVTSQDKWKIVYSKLGLQSPTPTGFNQLKAAYTRFLHSFENFNRKLGCTMVTHIRSTRGRHRSDRNFPPRTTVMSKVKGRAKDKSVEKKPAEEKISPSEKKEPKAGKSDEKIKKKLDKPKEEKAKPKKEDDKPRLVRSQSLIKDKRDTTEDKKETRTDRARAREESKKEKSESPEKKKETRSSSKLEQEREKKDKSTSDNKSVDTKEIKDRSPKGKKDPKLLPDRKDDLPLKERKVAEEKLRSWRDRFNKGDKSKVKNEEKSMEREKKPETIKEKRSDKSETDSPKHEVKITREKREVPLIKPEKEEVEVKIEKVDIVEIKSPIPEKDIKPIENEDSIVKEKPAKSLRHEENLLITKVKIEKLDVLDAEMSISQSSSRSILFQDDEDSNKDGLSRKLEGDDEKSLMDVTESEGDDDETESEKSEKDGKERQIEIGDRVKVKYGRGRTRKVYEAKVLDVDTRGGEKRYYVHYAGWNTRYDEWIRRNFIVENITERGKLAKQQKLELLNKGSLSLAKKPTRPPGLGGAGKLTRKNSTSSTTSVSSSRTTRSDKNGLQTSPFTRGIQPKRRMRRKSGISTTLTDTSQDSESDDDDMLFLYPEGEMNDDDDEPETEIDSSDRPSDTLSKDKALESYEESNSGQLSVEPKCEQDKEMTTMKISELVDLPLQDNVSALSLTDTNSVKPAVNESRPSCILPTKSEMLEKIKIPTETPSINMKDSNTLTFSGIDSSKTWVSQPLQPVLVCDEKKVESISKATPSQDATLDVMGEKIKDMPKEEAKVFQQTPKEDSHVVTSSLKKQEIDSKQEERMPKLSTYQSLESSIKPEISLKENSVSVTVDNQSVSARKEIFPGIEDKAKISGKLTMFHETKPQLPLKSSNIVQHVGLFGDINFSTRSDPSGKSLLSKFSSKKASQASELISCKECLDEVKTDKTPQGKERITSSKETIFLSALGDKKVDNPESSSHPIFAIGTDLIKSTNKSIDKGEIEKESVSSEKSNSSSSSNSSIPGLKEAIAGSIDENTSSSSIDFTDIFKKRSAIKYTLASPKLIATNPSPTSFSISKTSMNFKPTSKIIESFSGITVKKLEKTDTPGEVPTIKSLAVDCGDKTVKDEPPVANEKDKAPGSELKDTPLPMSVITFIGSTSSTIETTSKMSEKSPLFECNNENTDDYELSALNEDTSIDEAKIPIKENSSPKHELLSEVKDLTDDKIPIISEEKQNDAVTGEESLSSNKKLSFDDCIPESLTELSIDDEYKDENEKPDKNSSNNSNSSNVFLNVTSDKTFKDSKELFSSNKMIDATEVKKDDASSESSKLPSSPDKSNDDALSSDKTVSNKDSEDNASSSSFLVSKKENKKKKCKLSKKTLNFDSSEKDETKLKEGKSKSKKKKIYDGNEFSKSEQKSKAKRLKKSKNKKRFARHEDYNLEMGNDEDRDELSEKTKRKEKRKREDKKFSKFELKAEGSSGEPSKKERKKGRKNKPSSDKKIDLGEKKVKKKKKTHTESNIVDSDSEKDSLIRIGSEKKKKKEKKKPKLRDSSSSDDGTEGKLLIDEAKDFSERDEKCKDPDMSFLLCEEKVPASPVNAGPEDTTASSSIDESNNVSPSSDEEHVQAVDLEMYARSANLGLLGSVNKHSDTCAVLDNTPPTTPSSTESIPSSSPSHDREPFVHYTESTQSGRDSGDGESDSFTCRAEVTESEEYRAAATLAFAVCKSVPEKPRDCSTRAPLKRQKSENDDCSPPKRRKKTKRSFSQQDTPSKPRIKGFRYSKGDSFDAFDSETYPMNVSSMSHGHTSALCSSFSHSSNRQSSHSSEASSCRANRSTFYMPLHDCKDPEKRINILQDKMSELKKIYASLKAEVATIDRRRKKARKKMREAAGSNANNSSTQSEDGQNCS